MPNDKFFTTGELRNHAEQLVRILSTNSPKRDDDAYPHVIKRRGVIISPFPGNLKVNGNEIRESTDGMVVRHGYEPARYALYANKTSRKPGYIEKSIQEFANYLRSEGWTEE